MAEISTNPFRRKGPTPAVDAPAIPQAASPAAFLESITTAASTPDSEDVDSRDGRPTKTKTKVVKRVRVQSPPPLSPDSPVKTRYQGDDSSDDDDDLSSRPRPHANADDPFEQRFPANPDHFALPAMPEAAPLVAANQGLANPFGMNTSFDTTENGQERDAAATAAPPGKGALDVNAFSRLLLTGQSGRDNSTETSSISKHSVSDGPYDAPSPMAAVEVTPRTSHEATDQEREEAVSHHAAGQTPVQKKAPPPPTSRRGKVIKPAAGEDGPFTSPLTPRSPSDVNKPLPPAPRAHDTDEEVDDIFAREAAGKTPERPDAAKAPEASSGKKPTPAPPPRRGHSRSESKLAGTTQPPTHDDEAQPRSSLESQHSRLESAAGRQAPAPPPPRRPGASQRLSSHFGSALASPTSPSISEAEVSPLGFPAEHSNASVDTVGDEHPRIAPPPPPPARNPSTRRPNPRSAEGARRSLGNREKDSTMAPPPPPPRQRGSSKGSMDGPGPVGRGSLDSVRVFTPPGPQGGIAEEAAAEERRGEDILADLDALQREVDALRGKYGS
ncbi:hypothetical protein B0T11DRAFT_77832 [Plectosphaerella cucumerina]|uniref:Uncharacterized protein n=1 Tax=Plectosphaerella cucumerina TaxID=40658 RepID=A0A8K0X2M9_9PEZI|nr:hypothetical protein B0T11DRAFT_77832 [Plectosphaerella cucumerina]